jgi:tRNA modification GTPase
MSAPHHHTEHHHSEEQDVVESIGIKKTFEKIEQAQVVLFLIDSLQLIIDNEESLKIEIEKIRNKFPQKALIFVVNKVYSLTVLRKGDGPNSSINYAYSSIVTCYSSGILYRWIKRG